jgi:hypothetical protein
LQLDRIYSFDRAVDRSFFPGFTRLTGDSIRVLNWREQAKARFRDDSNSKRASPILQKSDAHLTTKALLSSDQESSSLVVDQKAPKFWHLRDKCAQTMPLRFPEYK